MNRDNLNSVWGRFFNDETPKFWVQIRNYAALIAAISLTVASVDSAPEKVSSIAWTVFAVTSAIAGTAQGTSTGKTRKEAKAEKTTN